MGSIPTFGIMKSKPTKQELIDHVESLVAKCAELTRERDEARRMWCEAAPVGNCLSVDDMNQRARAEAKRRGWDCYKENTGYLQDLG